MINKILLIFIILRFAQYLFEKYLSQTNRRYYLNPQNQKQAIETLGLSSDDWQKTLVYTNDKYHFARLSGWINITAMMLFLATGMLGVYESWAKFLASLIADNEVVTGLILFGLLGLTVLIYGIPFSYYHTFVIEQKHGFNRQTKKGFLSDLLKATVLGAILGGLVFYVILQIMASAGEIWWVYAWLALSAFSILTAWLYPTLLAPLFNKFTPLKDGELKAKINDLADKIAFKTSGLFVMDASKRSSHGNAYFTGMFGKKRIVLFDTLLDSMSNDEVIAVLAHELGHFKLHHVRWMLIRSTLMSGLTFYLLSLFLPKEEFYFAFGLQGISNYGALIVFSLWFGLVEFVLQPWENYLSRRNEFAADSFAMQYIMTRSDLRHALLKLREKSHSMPITHPLFSMFYYSHPPMLERLKAMQ